jgi:hypothetical protein
MLCLPYVSFQGSAAGVDSSVVKDSRGLLFAIFITIGSFFLFSFNFSSVIIDFSTFFLSYGDDPINLICFTSFNPWFFTGYTDGDGSFSVTISSSKTHQCGWRVMPTFIIAA